MCVGVQARARAHFKTKQSTYTKNIDTFTIHSSSHKPSMPISFTNFIIGGSVTGTILVTTHRGLCF